MTLTLVRPSREGQDGGRVRRRRPSVSRFSSAQRARIRATLRNLRAAYGSWSCLAEVTGFSWSTLSSAASDPRKATLSLVYGVARAAGMTVDQVLAPGLVSVADVCPTCGRKGGAS